MATVSFVGNLGRDPEKKSDKAPVRFSVADRDARDEKDDPWIDVSVWGKHGDICLEHLHKGSKVFVSGQLTMELYEGKRYPKVRADRVTFLDKKADAPAADPAASEDDGNPFA